MKAGRYKEGAHNRQKIIDYLIANPDALASKVAEGIGMDKSDCSKRMMNMFTHGELSRHKVHYTFTNSSGKVVAVTGYLYSSKVTQTAGYYERPAEVVKDKKSKPGHYIHNPWAEDHVPPRNQGGQGAIRQRVYVASCGA